MWRGLNAAPIFWVLPWYARSDCLVRNCIQILLKCATVLTIFGFWCAAQDAPKYYKLSTWGIRVVRAFSRKVEDGADAVELISPDFERIPDFEGKLAGLIESIVEHKQVSSVELQVCGAVNQYLHFLDRQLTLTFPGNPSWCHGMIEFFLPPKMQLLPTFSQWRRHNRKNCLSNLHYRF
jgi:hypothetical protein